MKNLLQTTRHFVSFFLKRFRFLIILGTLLSYSNLYAQNCTANAGGNIVVCGNSSSLVGIVSGSVAAANPVWTFISGPGSTPTFGDPNALTTTVNGMNTDGVYTFQLSQLCGSGTSIDLVSITAHPQPPSFTAGADITGICAATGTTALAGVIPAGYTGVWTSRNVYSWMYGSGIVSTNSVFSNANSATSTFSLINKANHDIDPSYDLTLTITSTDGMCTYSDVVRVTFCVSPVLVAPSAQTICGLGVINFYMGVTGAQMASSPSYQGAGQTPDVTYTVNTLTKPGGAGTLTFNELTGRYITLSGFTVAGTYTFTITVASNCGCGTSTTGTITVNMLAAAPKDPIFQMAGHPEQIGNDGGGSGDVYAYGNSAGEVHCGIAGTATPELFYFNIDPSDPASTSAVAVTSGLLPPGASTPIATISGAGTMNRTVSVAPGASGWKVGTYAFDIQLGSSPCTNNSTYYIHISNSARTAISVANQSICYPGAGAVSTTIALPTVFQGAVNSSYFQDFLGRWDLAVVSKPAGSGNPTFDADALRSLTNTSTGIYNMDTPGDYVFSITAFNGNGVGAFLEKEYACSGIASITANFTIHIENKIVANAGSNQSLGCTSSIFLLGNSPGTGSGLWTNVSNPGSLPSIVPATSFSVIPTNLNVAGNYTFKWTITSLYGSCTSNANITFNISAVSPVAPVIGTITQPTCAVPTGSVALSGLPAGSWTLSTTPVTSNLPGSGTTATFTGLTPNTYTFTVNDGVCSSLASASVVINPQPITPSAPIIGTITQPTCAVSTGGISFSGLPSVGAWTATLSPGGTTLNGVGPTTTGSFTGLTPNTYTISVLSSSGCTSVPSLNTIVNALPTPPAAASFTTTQPTCAVSTRNITITSPLALEYNIDGGTFQTSTSFLLMSAGSHTITVRNPSDITCVSSATVVFAIVLPTAPVAASFTTTQPTCALSTRNITITSPMALEYNIDGGTFQTSTSFLLMSAGSHTITVRNPSDITCVSSATVVPAIVLPTLPVAASCFVTQPTCTVSTGTITVSSPIGGFEYNIDNTFFTTSTIFTNIISGIHIIEVRSISDNTCVSSPTSVLVNSQLIIPSTPIIDLINQTSCTVPVGSVNMSGFPTVGSWSAIITSAVYTSTINNSSSPSLGTGIFSNLNPGTYNVNVVNSDNCVSSSSLAIVINPQPITPSSPVIGSVIQPTCSISTGSIDVSGMPTTGTWIATITATGFSSSISDISPITGGSFLNLNSGTYSITVTNSDDCISISTANVVINAQPIIPAIPTIGAIIQPTCSSPSGSIQLSGLPSVGGWTITSTPAGLSYIETGTNTTVTFTGVSTDSYVFTVLNSEGCPSSGSVVTTINTVPTLPMSTSFVSIIQPTCDVSTGSITFVAQNGFEYCIGGNFQTGVTFNDVDPGDYVLTVSNPLDNTCSIDTAITILLKICEIDVPTAFTPDHDNVNDKWELHNIDKVFPNNEVTIYNRWGSLIFESPAGNYENNSWDGTYNGNALPVDSYYFIIEYNDAAKKETSKGTITIILK